MSEFAVIFDPVRNLPFAIVIRDNDNHEIKALTTRAQSWANSQFDDIEIPNNMSITEYKSLTDSIKNVIESYEFTKPDLIKTIASNQFIHSARYKSSKQINKISQTEIRKFAKKSKLSIIDFKAKKFVNTSKKSSVNKNSIKNDYIRSVVGSGISRRIQVSAKQLVSLGAVNRRTARRARDLSTQQKSEMSYSQRVDVSVTTKYLGFRQI